MEEVTLRIRQPPWQRVRKYDRRTPQDSSQLARRAGRTLRPGPQSAQTRPSTARTYATRRNAEPRLVSYTSLVTVGVTSAASEAQRQADHPDLAEGIAARAAQREGVGLTGQDGEGGCYLGKASADVGPRRGHGACASASVLVAGVGLRDGEAEAAFNPGQDRVPYPVRADLLGLDPWQVLAEAVPEVVVPAGCDRRAGRVAEQTLWGLQAASGFRVGEAVGHQRRGNRLPAFRVALLVQPD